jgi:hypothetical protein
MGTLLEDLKKWYEDANYPPDGGDLDYGQNTETELVSEEDLDQARWGTWFQNVYKRGDELIALVDCRPATENQDWGDYGEPTFYPVRAEAVTVIKYVKL